jgi:prepilin-type N-terminal cleavage/methylation domain-containing protein/prepilin-type processing-associated H-X9-DG protein
VRTFTLIELLVVVAIISILMSIMLPALRKSMDMAKSSSCRNKLKQIGLGTHMYVDDYDGYTPYIRISDVANPDYGKRGFTNSWSTLYAIASYVGMDNWTAANHAKLSHPEQTVASIFNCPAVNRHNGSLADHWRVWVNYGPNGQIDYWGQRGGTREGERREWKVSQYKSPSTCIYQTEPAFPYDRIYSKFNDAAYPFFDRVHYGRHGGIGVNVLYMDGRVEQSKGLLPNCSQLEYWTPDMAL